MKTKIPEPAISRKSLIRSSGIFWIIGGSILIFRAVTIFDSYTPAVLIGIAIAAIAGYLKHKMILSKVVYKNIKRIFELSPHKEKICFFAFQSMQSYLIILLMVPLGIVIRHSGLPHNWVGWIYIVIATALITSAMIYLTTKFDK